MSMFELATRLKLRFDTPKGQIGVEDLWDLPLTSATGRANLDDIARNLDRELKSSACTSFVSPETPKNDAAQLMFDVVIHIINVKVADRKVAQDAAAIREKKQKIMAIIEQKQDQALTAASLEDLEAMLTSL
jgi:hypothetical protein